MQLAINSDYLQGTYSAEPWLKHLSEAGFTHLHWCHHWNTDFMFGKHEIAQIKLWLKEYGLKLLDIHGSDGSEKCWYSLNEYQRRAGIELVANRIEMMDALDAQGTLIMHPWSVSEGMTEEAIASAWKRHEALQHSIDELLPMLEKYHVRIGLENRSGELYMQLEDNLQHYPKKYIGLTYDSGHGNSFAGKGLEFIEHHKDRLQALHLNDNCGKRIDQHQPPMMGTVNWEKLVEILKTSAYTEPGRDGTQRPLSFEISMVHTPYMDTAASPAWNQKPENIKAFLADAYERSAKIAKMTGIE